MEKMVFLGLDLFFSMRRIVLCDVELTLLRRGLLVGLGFGDLSCSLLLVFVFLGALGDF